ncbi:DUF1517 domain containing protein [Nitzschia inconspicua]|uniref:DUF1517 domain containing protein n=1 Tax=Nitzschia inconspicua TaxID=303405 RepID=A0A9K3LF60_9STRA|nr:DUF1517 domain containing protein [Nitzschia inconspicua]
MARSALNLVAILAWTLTLTLPVKSFLSTNHRWKANLQISKHVSSTRQFLFDKIFEEEGALGKGITVGKISVALQSRDRSDTSIFGLLESHATDESDANEDLARMANNVCLDLMRKSEDWVAACSSSKWFSTKDAGKAESYYNDLANNEAVKFEKEYIPEDEDESDGGPTLVVVTLVLEIQGDSTNFEGAGYSISKTKEVLASIASDCLVDDGYCVNAVEVFWTPSDRNEVLSKNDVVLDFPELIDV